MDDNGGTLEVGGSLSGSYTYSDAESELKGSTIFSLIQTESGLGELPSTYTMVHADTGTMLTFEVTPITVPVCAA